MLGHAEKGMLQQPHNLCILIRIHCYLRAGFRFKLKSSFEFTARGFTHLGPKQFWDSEATSNIRRLY